MIQLGKNRKQKLVATLHVVTLQSYAYRADVIRAWNNGHLFRVYMPGHDRTINCHSTILSEFDRVRIRTAGMLRFVFVKLPPKK